MIKPQLYAGMSLVSARPMNRGDYNTYRKWTIPADENPNDEGYVVWFENGHQNWQPKETFEKDFYLIKDGMSFSLALDFVKRHGARVARKGWNGKGMFIFLVPGSTFTVNREPLLTILGEGTQVNYHGHIDMKTADGMIVPWVASQTDLLAEDWQVA